MALVEILRPTIYQGTRYFPAKDGEKPLLVEIADECLGPLIQSQYVRASESPPPKPKKSKPSTDE